MTEEQQGNEVVLREMFAAFERGDYAESDTFLTPDNRVIGSTTSHFQPAVATTMTQRAHMLDEAYPEWKVTLRDVVPAADGQSPWVLVTSLQRLTRAATAPHRRDLPLPRRAHLPGCRLSADAARAAPASRPTTCRSTRSGRSRRQRYSGLGCGI